MLCLCERCLADMYSNSQAGIAQISTQLDKVSNQLQGVLQGFSPAQAQGSPVRGGGGGALASPAWASSSSGAGLPTAPPVEVVRFLTNVLKNALMADPLLSLMGNNKKRDQDGLKKYSGRPPSDIVEHTMSLLRSHGASRTSYLTTYNPVGGVSMHNLNV